MARLSELVTLTEGRDRGKQFRLSEMYADAGERWAYRALLAISRSGVNVPPGLLDQGWAGLAAMMPYLIVIGFQGLSGARWEELEPLLNEMMACVMYQPPGPYPPQPLGEGPTLQVEEVKSLATLKMAVLKLHVDFSAAVSPQATGETPQADSAV